jgi:hypothetical protein
MSETHCVFCNTLIDVDCPVVKDYNLGRCCKHHAHDGGGWEGSPEQKALQNVGDEVF